MMMMMRAEGREVEVAKERKEDGLCCLEIMPACCSCDACCCVCV